MEVDVRDPVHNFRTWAISALMDQGMPPGLHLLLQEARGQDFERLRRDGFGRDVHEADRLSIWAGDFLPRHQHTRVGHEILVLDARAIRGFECSLEVRPFPRRTEQRA